MDKKATLKVWNDQDYFPKTGAPAMSSEGFKSLIIENVVLIDYEFVSTLLINVLLCLF